MRVVVIDGQGGRMGRAVIDAIKAVGLEVEIIAVGTNSAATACMMGGRPDAGATGENAVKVNAHEADVIVGPIGIVMADALHGEITKKMASAITRSSAKKILIPVSKCSAIVVGTGSMTLTEMVAGGPMISTLPTRTYRSLLLDDTYTGDWDEISEIVRAGANWTCQERCVDLEDHRDLLHVHHINGGQTR